MTNDIDLDFDRARRIGMGEIVYGAGKSRDQLQRIATQHGERGANLLITRCALEQVEGLAGEYDPVARCLIHVPKPPPMLSGVVGVVFAGSSDLPVAAEAECTLRFLGCDSTRFGDCGVAGVHRLLAHREALAACRVLIVIAGFEGALPTVVAGLLPLPVIAVPSSVGYGVAAGGHTALHAMLASCAGGVTVVNIDNGCGAAMAARRILQCGVFPCEP
jgi:NCAIR mutase (PurE)-related protein